MCYELLQRLFVVDFGGTQPTGSHMKAPAGGTGMTSQSSKLHNPDHIGGYQAALPMLTGIETKFGLSLPRFASTIPNPSPVVGKK